MSFTFIPRRSTRNGQATNGMVIALCLVCILGCAHNRGSNVQQSGSAIPAQYQQSAPSQQSAQLARSVYAGSQDGYQVGLNPEHWQFLNDETPNEDNNIMLVSTENGSQNLPSPPQSSYFDIAPIPGNFPNRQPQTQLRVATQQSSNVKPSSTLSAGKSKNSLLNLLNLVKYELVPRNDRMWTANHAVNPTVEFNPDNTVTVYNIRYTEYRTAKDYTTHYYNARFDLADIRTMDLIEVPFNGAPTMAHVEVSFGFADGRQLGLSVEGRYEVGESYDPLGGTANQFELIYMLANERDIIRLATDINKNDVYLYRLKLTPDEVRTVFVDVLNRVNKLAKEPEFYHTITNNCTTNIINHINKARPKAIPWEYRSLFPGLLDSLLYDLQLVETKADTFQEARSAAKINPFAELYGDSEYFSAGIRQALY